MGESFVLFCSSVPSSVSLSYQFTNSVYVTPNVIILIPIDGTRQPQWGIWADWLIFPLTRLVSFFQPHGKESQQYIAKAQKSYSSLLKSHTQHQNGTGWRFQNGWAISSWSKYWPKADYLRGNVVWSTTEGGGGDSIQDAFFTHAKVCQFTVAFCIQQNIVQL